MLTRHDGSMKMKERNAGIGKMKKIGFIDYYLNEWHADNYPAWIKELSGGEYQVCYAYAYRQPPEGMGRKSNEEWAAGQGIELPGRIEDVIAKSDCLVVLSPDNPEMHEKLCELPLKSGKRTYVDKTFAPDKASALRIFANADAHGTPCYSSSALRFASELDAIDVGSIYKIDSEGPGRLEIYSIHQLEPIVRLMNSRAKRLMYLGDEKHPSMILEFEDGRYAQMIQRDDEKSTFRMTVINGGNKAVHYEIKSDFFKLFIKEMIRFFDTGIIPVSHEQTVDVIAAREVAIRASREPFVWFDV